MCGIAGFWNSENTSELTRIAGAMAGRLEHRGPDDGGTWEDREAGIAFGHRRLSIIDVSTAGHQPMVSRCGRFAVVYNGEIYNHAELREELERDRGFAGWKGHSDTETLLAGLMEWGVERTLGRLNGMFAFAYWDGSARQLYLARDRAGEKPLYYGRAGDAFLFASELKAFDGYPGWSGEVDRDALCLYLRHNYIPAPWSIYRGIQKLLPAHFLVVGQGGRSVGDPRCYWDLRSVVEGSDRSGHRDPAEAVDQLDELLRDAVRSRMLADVPLGAFLSGGIDSSTVVALMQTQSSQPVKTFSIGFSERAYDEAPYAKQIASHLGTDHTEWYVTPEDALRVVPDLPAIWDEPFSDSSQIPTYLVSRLARSKVTVSLSGDGGDELFYGYNRYALGSRLWRRMHRMPPHLRRFAAAVLRKIPAGIFDQTMRRFPRKFRFHAVGDRILKAAEVLSEESAEAFYRRLVSHWPAPDEIVIGGREPSTILSNPARWPRTQDFRERMMFFDTLTYLPDDILTKVDRASMAVSLESRVPLLDHRVMELAWQMPMELKMRGGVTKWLLRQVLYRYVPKRLVERPKMGFGVPIESWLRGPLREWAEALLDENRLREEGFFDPTQIRIKWRQHLSGERRWHYPLWDILMFQAWREARTRSRIGCRGDSETIGVTGGVG
ncbi:MAG: asparagine synthase (glutamine-hydrolyzing) [Thermoanaerobaculia bacterium]